MGRGHISRAPVPESTVGKLATMTANHALVTASCVSLVPRPSGRGKRPGIYHKFISS